MLRLRAYQSSDAERIAAWLEDERQLFLWSAGRMQWPLTREQFQNFAAEQLQQPRTMLITAIDEFNEPVGFLCMTRADYQQKRIHFCFIVVTNQSRGKGYGTQMLQQAIGYAVDLLQMERITLRVFAENTAARKCYQKLGFVDEACHPAALQWQGRDWAAYDMVWLKENSSYRIDSQGTDVPQ